MTRIDDSQHDDPGHVMSDGGAAMMRAVIATAFGEADVLEVRDAWPMPRPGAGQVAIAVRAAGVNFAEIMSRRVGYLGVAPPFVPGLEVAGTVRAIGDGVDGVAVGDRVCALTLTGGYAEVALADAKMTFPLPAGVGWAVGSALPTIVPTAYALLHPLGRVGPGDRVLVNAAAGGTGMILGQMAKHAGARQVTGIVSSAAKVPTASGYGFDDVVTVSDADSGAIADASFDLVLESVGGSARDLARRATAPLGRLLLYGNSGGDPEPALTPQPCATTTCSSAGGASRPSRAEIPPCYGRSPPTPSHWSPPGRSRSTSATSSPSTRPRTPTAWSSVASRPARSFSRSRADKRPIALGRRRARGACHAHGDFAGARAGLRRRDP